MVYSDESVQIHTILSMDKKIWSSQSNRYKYGIKFKSLADTEQNECQRIIDYSIYLVAARFDCKVTFKSIMKTTIGYLIRLRCSKNSPGCRQNWKAIININNNNVKLCHKEMNRSSSALL